MRVPTRIPVPIRVLMRMPVQIPMPVQIHPDAGADRDTDADADGRADPGAGTWGRTSLDAPVAIPNPGCSGCHWGSQRAGRDPSAKDCGQRRDETEGPGRQVESLEEVIHRDEPAAREHLSSHVAPERARLHSDDREHPIRPELGLRHETVRRGTDLPLKKALEVPARLGVSDQL